MYTIEPRNHDTSGQQDIPQPRLSIDRPSFYGSHFSTLTSTSTSTPKRKKRYSVDARMFVTSRQEFLPGEPNGSPVRYKKQGGIFLTKKGICFLILGIVLSLALIGVLVYFLAPPRYNQVVAPLKSSEIKDIKALFENADQVVRLPDYIVPSFYRLKIKPNFKTFVFEGNVSITISTTKSDVNQITLHSKNLEILNGTTLIEQNVITSSPFDTDAVLNRLKRNPTPQNSNMVIPINRDKINEESSATTDAPKISITGLPNLNSTKEILNEPKNSNLPIIDAPILSQVQSEFIEIKSVEKKPLQDMIVFNLGMNLKTNTNYTISIYFKGKIDDSLSGFYRSVYRDSNNKTKFAGVTHFQPTSARKAFPCFDEPEFKAAFELSIARNKTLQVLSNMPLLSEEDEGEDIKWSHFEKSLPMSTYLVAFFISDFESVSLPVVSSGTQIKIWTRKEMVPYTQYAVEITPKIFKFYEDFFKMPYSLPKLDMVAVPDIAIGAMENWGLITFRETSLLTDPVKGSIKSKQAIAMIIAHELAHQWFSNLVTMKWWNDLWLSEGFATYMEYICINTLEPSWGLSEQFSLDRISVFELDSLQSTRPVSAALNKKLTIAQLFDDISYIKAASLLVMLNQVLTKELFQDGLIRYIKDWQFKNTNQNHLWSAFSSVIGNSTLLPSQISINDFMDSWILQTGYPVINVTRHYENSTATISQNRFYVYQPLKEEENQLWHVPITYTVGNVKIDDWASTPNAWLEKKSYSTVSLPDGSNSTWAYFNIRATGYYRINYDFKNWKLLEYGLYDAPLEFPAVTRGQILDDAFHLAQAGYINYTVALDLTKYMIDTETNILPWWATLRNLQLLFNGLQRNKSFRYFQEYISRLVVPALKKFSYDTMANDTSQDTILRDQLIYWACLVEEQECLDWVQNHFKNWMNQSEPDKINPIPRNNRVAVYSTALRMGNKREFDFLLGRLENSNDADVQTEILMSLPNSRIPWQIYSLLEYSLDVMEIQMTPALWIGFDNDIAIQTAFNFVIENWDRIFARYSRVDEQIFPYIINGAFGNIASEQELFQFEEFIRLRYKDLTSVSKDILKNLEKAKSRINWNKSKIDDIEKWLIKFSESKTTSVNEFSTLYGKYGALSELSQNFGEYLHTLIDDKEPTGLFFMG